MGWQTAHKTLLLNENRRSATILSSCNITWRLLDEVETGLSRPNS